MSFVRYRRVEEDKISYMWNTVGRTIQEADLVGVWRRGAGGLLISGYLQWERDDGQVVCRLVTRKTQLASKVKITIPRMELVAAVNSVRLARKGRESLRIPLAGTRYFMDSSAVLGMLRMKSGRFTEFVGARVSKVKVNSNIEEE